MPHMSPVFKDIGHNPACRPLTSYLLQWDLNNLERMAATREKNFIVSSWVLEPGEMTPFAKYEKSIWLP